MGHGVSDIMEFIQVNYSVLVCDDDSELAVDCVDRIKALELDEYHVRTEPNDLVHAAMSEILSRRRAARDGKIQERGDCIFDGIDILIIDYDLVHIDDDNTEYTGESLARLARTFSDCAVVVVLNQFGPIDFDLSLRGHLASHADLNIGAERLATSGLWRDPPWKEFRPWSWPVLSQAVESQRARERVMALALDSPIVDTFGMQVTDASRLSDSAFGFIAPDAEDFDSLQRRTFKSFLTTTPDGRDAESLLDTAESPAAVRFVAARIGKWLERELLGPQDVLIDVPHLLLRFPFLLGRDVSDKEVWNDTIHRAQRLQEALDDDWWFEPADCLSRAAVWCRRLEADERISRQRAEFDFSTVPSIVFMEDCSEFADISEGTEFRAGFHNAFDRRFVRRVAGVRYGPQRRFAFGK